MCILSIDEPGRLSTRKEMPRLMILVLWLLIAHAVAHAQFAPVRIQVAVTPPYSTKINEYTSHPNKVLVTLHNLSPEAVALRVYLRGEIAGASGIKVYTQRDYRPVNPIILEPGAPFLLTLDNIQEIFGVNALRYEGITEHEIIYGNGLPEDDYTICVQVFDHDTGQLLSDEAPFGCSVSFAITNLEPPVITQPFSHQEITPIGPQNMVFSWTMPAGAPPHIQYRFEMVEVAPPGHDPDDAVDSAAHPMFFERVISGNVLVFGPAQPALVEGKTYAFRVTAFDPMGKLAFRNRGRSEVCSFTYGKSAEARALLPPNVRALLEFLEQDHSPEEVNEAIKKARFSPAEMDVLQKEAMKPAYQSIIMHLKHRADRLSIEYFTKHQGQSFNLVRQHKQNLIDQDFDEQLNRNNRELKSRLRPIEAPMQMSFPTHRLTTVPRTLMQDESILSSRGTTARISEVTPPAIVVGDNFTITGAGFENEQGRVTLIIGEELVECPVVSWRSQEITATIPDFLQPEVSCSRHGEPLLLYRGEREPSGGRFGTRGSPVSLWVKLQGQETGPLHKIEILLDTDAFRPEINSVFPSEIRPGSEMLIEGSWFMNNERDDRTDQLTITFGRHELDYQVIEWRNDAIYVRIAPEIEGLPAYSTGQIRVQNCLRQEAFFGRVSFVPQEEILILEPERRGAVCWPSPFPCFFGRNRQYDIFDFEFQNGWEVEDSWLRIRQYGVNSGAYYERQPNPGSADPRTAIVVWTDGFSRVECDAYLSIKGPKGLPPF